MPASLRQTIYDELAEAYRASQGSKGMPHARPAGHEPEASAGRAGAPPADSPPAYSYSRQPPGAGAPGSGGRAYHVIESQEPLAGGDSGVRHEQNALIKVLTESLGPALSNSSQEVLLLRQENRQLRDRLAMAGAAGADGAGAGDATAGSGGPESQTVGGLQRRLKAEAEIKASLVSDLVLLRQQLDRLQGEDLAPDSPG